MRVNSVINTSSKSASVTLLVSNQSFPDCDNFEADEVLDPESRLDVGFFEVTFETSMNILATKTMVELT